MQKRLSSGRFRFWPEDWNRIYGHPIHYLEAFVDPERFRGTCYRAANWKVLGRTTGRGKDAPIKKPNRSIKEVFGYHHATMLQSFLAEKLHVLWLSFHPPYSPRAESTLKKMGASEKAVYSPPFFPLLNDPVSALTQQIEL